MNIRGWGLIAIITLVSMIAFGASPALGSEGQGKGRATHIIVFNENVNANDAAKGLARAHGLGVTHVYGHALSGMAAKVPPGRVNALLNDPRVAFVEANQEVHLFQQDIPTGVQRIFADENANIGIDGNDDMRVDVDVAVLDTGIYAGHSDINVFNSTDCTNESGGPPWARTATCGSGGGDGHGHGTHVAGTIAAIDNDFGVVGVAPGARLWAVKVLEDNGSGTIAMIVAGIDYVTANADTIEVANMSLGCECSSDALDTAISNSVAAGVTYAVAAGNNAKDASTFSPANHPDVITTSGIADFDGEPGGLQDETVAFSTCTETGDDTSACFSNFGPEIEIAAPGVEILSTWNDGGYNTISGTSMASPHVAGAAALLAASGVSGPANIRSTLISEGNFDWVDESGDGILEPLLDVSNSSVFAPAMVAGGGSQPSNDTPVVTITSPADGATFDSGVSIDFAGSASDTEDGDLTANLAWTSSIDGAIGSGGSFSAVLSDGNHTITASVTDSDGASGEDSISITVGSPPPSATTVSVDSITYTTEGGKNNDKHLNITIALVDDLGNPVGGASVSIDLYRDSLLVASGTASTGTDGTVLFSLKNAASGTYETVVTNVSADGLTWDGITPSNSFDKN